MADNGRDGGARYTLIGKKIKNLNIGCYAEFELCGNRVLFETYVLPPPRARMDEETRLKKFNVSVVP